MNKQEPKVSIVFLNWNGKKYTFGLIKSLREMRYKNFDIIVVDNGSTDGSQKAFDKKFGNVATMIKNEKNYGEAEGLNIGIRKGLKRKSKYVLIMDNDIYVDKEFLSSLVDVMEKTPEAGVVGPKIYYSSPKNKIWSAGCDYHFRGFRSRNQDEIDIGQADEEKIVDAVDCVMLMRSKVLIEKGILSGNFFTMHEMTEWCLRISKSNYHSIYVPKAKVWHKVSAYWSQDQDALERTRYYDLRNWLLTMKKNERKYYFLLVLFLELTILMVIRFIRYLKKGNTKLIKTYFIAIYHALINKTPMELYPYDSKESKSYPR